jgi:hypothetical protein
MLSAAFQLKMAREIAERCERAVFAFFAPTLIQLLEAIQRTLILETDLISEVIVE